MKNKFAFVFLALILVASLGAVNSQDTVVAQNTVDCGSYGYSTCPQECVKTCDVCELSASADCDCEEAGKCKHKVMLKNKEKKVGCANCDLVSDQGKVQASLSNGRKAEIKVMPEVASERALERLRLNVCSSEEGCSIELKELNKELVYSLKEKKRARLFGFIGTNMDVEAQVSAEDVSEEVKLKRPWWSFLASEAE